MADGPADVSALEARGLGRARVETLRRFVAALGGELHLVVSIAGAEQFELVPERPAPPPAGARRARDPMDSRDLIRAIRAVQRAGLLATSRRVKAQLELAGKDWGAPGGSRLNALDRALRADPNAEFTPFKMGDRKNSQIVFVKNDSHELRLATQRGWRRAENDD